MTLNFLLGLYNDHLMQLNMSSDKRIKYLNDSFLIIGNKIRDARNKHN